MLFQGAMVGIALSSNVLLMLVFWELTSLSSFLLIGFWRDRPDARQGARMALTITGGGGLALIAGLVLLGKAAGSYELATILARSDVVQASPFYPAILVLILLGAFTKSAQFPFHFWLPHAMAAPTPVSAYLHSATMVKAGVFLLARLWPVLAGTDMWFGIVTSVGLVTMLLGAAVALFRHDLKAILGYSTISQLGLMVMLLGFGTGAAVTAAVFHILNHAAFKAALFMHAGIIDHETGTRDIRRLGGLAALMPLTATLGVLAAAAMAGLPPLGGFISKEMMLEESAHIVLAGQHLMVPVLATVAAMLSAAYSLRYGVQLHFGARQTGDVAAPQDPGMLLILPPAILGAIALALGLLPTALAGPLVAAASAAATGGSAPDLQLALWHGVNPALLMSAGALAVAIGLLFAYLPVYIVVETLPVEPVHRKRNTDQPKCKEQAPDEREPNRSQALSVQAERAGIWIAAGHQASSGKEIKASRKSRRLAQAYGAPPKGASSSAAPRSGHRVKPTRHSSSFERTVHPLIVTPSTSRRESDASSASFLRETACDGQRAGEPERSVGGALTRAAYAASAA
jgi:multicomponent K+:H+ antiporter subunit A